MSDSSDDLKKLVKTLGEIAGYVATILPYLLALLGKGSLPYPALVATLTFVVSVIFLWRWRWPRITRMKSSAPNGKGRRQNRKQGLQALQDSFRAGTSHLYRMPLGRRRAEMTVLSLFAVGALGLGVVNSRSITEEITGFHCLSDARDFRVVITDFSPEEHQFENNLASIMDLHSGRKFQICRYNKLVELPDQAQEAGEKNKAELVIWGNHSGGLVNVYLTAIDWEMLNDHYGKLSSSEGQEEAAFLAANISAEILFKQGEVREAQKSLYDALDAAETQDWVQSNPALLEDGYLTLGLLFDPDYVPESDADIRTAIEQYTNAIRMIEKWDLDLEGAYLNRASLYYDQGNFEKAIADYTILINKNSEDAHDMYLMRAQVYMDAGNCSQAIADLETVLQDPDIEADELYPYFIHSLGTAYLLCDDPAAAQGIYQKMPALSDEDAEAFTSQLNDLAGSTGDSEVKEAIISIIERIRQLQAK